MLALSLLALACVHEYKTASITSISADSDGFYALVETKTYRAVGMASSLIDANGMVLRCQVTDAATSCIPVLQNQDAATAATYGGVSTRRAQPAAGPATLPGAPPASIELLVTQLYDEAGRATPGDLADDVAYVWKLVQAGTTSTDLRAAAAAGGAKLRNGATLADALARNVNMERILTAGGLSLASPTP